MEDLHIGVQVLCVFTSASNPNSFYGVKFWGYIDFSRVWPVFFRPFSHVYYKYHNFFKNSKMLKTHSSKIFWQIGETKCDSELNNQELLTKMFPLKFYHKLT